MISGTDVEKEVTLSTLAHLVVEDSAMDIVERAGGLGPLVEQARAGTEALRTSAVVALRHLSFRGERAEAALLEASAASVLLELTWLETEEQRFTAAGALMCLAYGNERSRWGAAALRSPGTAGQARTSRGRRGPVGLRRSSAVEPCCRRRQGPRGGESRRRCGSADPPGYRRISRKQFCIHI